MDFDKSSTVEQRTIVHLDVDAFYVACEREKRPDLLEHPVAVSQYNPYGNLNECKIEDPGRILYDGRNTRSLQHPNVNGSLIAVSYEARARNVRRNDRGLEAIKKCPELVIVQVPVSHGKASLTIYRDASERLMASLADFTRQSAQELYQEVNTCTESTTGSSFRVKSIPLEKASVDEVYLDISSPVQQIYEFVAQNKSWQTLYRALTSKEQSSAASHTTIGGLETRQEAIATNSLSKDDIRRGSSLQVLDSEGAAANEDEAGKAWWHRRFPNDWSDQEIFLAIGSAITLKAREAIFSKFDGIFTLSAGVSTNKTMAKLASGLKKPNRQTLVNPHDETTLEKLFHPLPLGRIRGLGGKLGDRIEETLKIKTVGDLKRVPLSRLRDEFGQKLAQFLFRIAQGICEEEVCCRSKPKCIGAGKTFQGVLAINSSDQEKLKHWIGNLVSDIIDRVSGDKSRYAKTLVCWLNMSPPGGSKKERLGASQSAPLPRSADAEKCTSIALKLANGIVKNAISKTKNSKEDRKALLIVGMSVTTTNFVDIAQGSNSILDAFQRCRNNSNNNNSSLAAADVVSKGLKNENPRPSNKPYLKVSPPKIKCTSSNSSDKFQAAGSTRALTSPPTDAHLPQVSNARTGPLGVSESGTKSHGEGILRPQVDLDVECQRELKLDNDKTSTNGGGVGAAAKPSVQQSCSSMDGDETNCLFEKDDNEDEDSDLQYAKQLQASYDRENEVISSMEKTRRSSILNRSVKRRDGKRRKLGHGSSRPISAFFSKK